MATEVDSNHVLEAGPDEPQVKRRRMSLDETEHGEDTDNGAALSEEEDSLDRKSVV